jgi:hypothetical protein
MRLFRRKRKPGFDPDIAAWLVAFREERVNASPWRRDYEFPDRIRISSDGTVSAVTRKPTT